MSDSEEPTGGFGSIRVGRHRLPAEKVIVAFILGVALILGGGFLISATSHTTPVPPRCSEIASFSLAGGETKSFTLNDGSRVVLAVKSADSSGGSGILMVGEQIESVSLSPGTVKEWNGVRVDVIGVNTSGLRSFLNLVAADCSSPAGVR